MKRFLLALTALLLTVLPAGVSFGIELGSGTTDYRNQVLYACGIIDLNGLDQPLTRQEFARMVVMASSARDSLGAAAIAAAPDVPAASEFAPYIRAALKNGWMRTKLGGVFDPAGTVTLNDAVKACMTMLGYADSDFQGNVNDGRLARFTSLGLKDGAAAAGAYDPLTKQDAVNILYNTLKANMKTGNSIGGSSIGLTLASDGELNASGVLDNTMKGPILATSYEAIKNSLPFDITEATCYFNGSKTDYYTNLQLLSFSNQIMNQGWIILYYNEATKTVWGYGSQAENGSYKCIRGTIQAIYYDAENIASPTSVSVNGTTYSLTGAEVKFLFSVNGSISVGDEVILILRSNTEGNSMAGDVSQSYTVTGAVLYHKKGVK